MDQIEAPRRSLTTFDVACLIVGTVLGAGIFKAPSIVAGQSGSGLGFLLVWLVGGFISIAGALCYAELSTCYPNAGGEYGFLKHTFGRNLSFFYAWSRAAVIVTGSMAILAITLGDYMAAIVPLGEHSNLIWASAAIIALTIINLSGIKQSKQIQNLLTVLEFLGVLAVVIAGFSVQGHDSHWAQLMSTREGTTNFGLAMVFVLLTYGGWNEAAYLSAEAKDARRGITRALILGLGLVMVLYLLANLAYLGALGLEGTAHSSAVAFDVFTQAFGKESAILFSTIIIFSCLNSLNATIVFGARGHYALGQDFRVFSWLGKWHVSGQPRQAILAQSLMAIALVGVAAWTRQGFQTLVEFTAPVFWFFISLVGVSLILRRQREPDLVRPFQVPLYPLVPLIFIASTTWLFWSSLMYAGIGAWIGVAVLASGLIPLGINQMQLRKQAALS
jgi:amino acid transporter